MLDDQEAGSDHSAGPGPYPSLFQQQQQQQQPQPQAFPPGQRGLVPQGQPQQPQPLPLMHPTTTTTMQPGDPNAQSFNAMNQMFDPFDPMLDADPFGLTASMHFPTQFTFQESAMRK